MTLSFNKQFHKTSLILFVVSILILLMIPQSLEFGAVILRSDLSEVHYDIQRV